jgi:hypothetical protein
MSDEIKTHPIQVPTNRSGSGAAPQAVTLAAYEVYSHVYGQQIALIEGSCRGGFSTGELIAFLYARSFPKSEWCDRVDEALAGLDLQGKR